MTRIRPVPPHPTVLRALELLEGRVVDVRDYVSPSDPRRQHEAHVHRGREVDWWQRADGSDVCGACHPRVRAVAAALRAEAGP